MGFSLLIKERLSYIIKRKTLWGGVNTGIIYRRNAWGRLPPYYGPYTVCATVVGFNWI
ncbi:Tat pathway signal sequence domain protein [Oceanobacillus picturae]|uniref:Tat pathway signal sequence domain protein n=1 Tax=Oceanobacillus picturae TaxID=171693 RepID=A0A0U9I014_9BACI|nr:Tat pathway signal sequence domain protein [Oceanobacillus picturae]